MLNARVTFSNLCGCDEPVSSVTVHQPEDTGEAGSCCGLSFCLSLFRLRGSQNAVLSNLRSFPATLPLRGGSLRVRAAGGLRHPGPGPQRANEGRGRQPAAVRHTAEPAGRRHRERPGQISWSLAGLPAVELLSLFLLRRCLVNQPGKTWTSGIFQVTIWEALTNSRPMPQSPMYEEDSQLER